MEPFEIFKDEYWGSFVFGSDDLLEATDLVNRILNELGHYVVWDAGKNWHEINRTGSGFNKLCHQKEGLIFMRKISQDKLECNHIRQHDMNVIAAAIECKVTNCPKCGKAL